MSTLDFTSFSFERNLFIKLKFVPKDKSNWTSPGPTVMQSNKIMPFIQTSLGEGQSARPKATTMYVYNMSLFLFVCLLNR